MRSDKISCLPSRRAPPESTPQRPTYDSWLRQRHVHNGAPDAWTIDRYAPCRDLKDQGIPCLVWFEDALMYYGVKTMRFDLHLLVIDVEGAKAALVERGWVVIKTGTSQHLSDIQRELCYMRRQAPPITTEPNTPDFIVSTILMPAKHWHVVLPNVASTHYLHPGPTDRWPFMPSLADTVNALIQKWLDTPTEQYTLRSYVLLMIAYVHDHLPILSEGDFIGHLAPEHRQYFLDLHAGMDMLTVDATEHERKVRNVAREAGWALQECSVSKEDERFFTRKRMERVRASQHWCYEGPSADGDKEAEEDAEDEAAVLSKGALCVHANLKSLHKLR
ncbi:MAG: hypothetical protein M1826_001739 [Phylliscum demangeonii]|nr:MAG: hypothetical protein M1826_001739 [Phylliscum demangeonii]